jgi:hypothetical protein
MIFSGSDARTHTHKHTHKHTHTYRCPSWGCALDTGGCDAATSKPADCPAGEQRCPDSLCYPGTGGLKECAKLGVQWSGCPPGMMECKGGKTGTCGKDVADCEVKVGCGNDQVFCGYQRDADGKPVRDETTGQPLANCKAAADCIVGQDRPPKPTTGPMDPRAESSSLEAKSEDGKQAMKLKMRKGSFTVGGVAVAVNFSIASVPDSLKQEGAFGALFDKGALLGSLVSIEPSAEVEIIGGMTLDIPILDATANENAAKCDLVLAQTKMLSISDITNVSEVPKEMDVCSRGEIGTCSCAVNITHFSTYGVVDAGVAYDPVTVPLLNSTNNTTDSLSDAASHLNSALSTCMLAAVTTLLALAVYF